jgi:hypothetical protein
VIEVAEAAQLSPAATGWRSVREMLGLQPDAPPREVEEALMQGAAARIECEGVLCSPTKLAVERGWVRPRQDMTRGLPVRKVAEAVRDERRLRAMCNRNQSVGMMRQALYRILKVRHPSPDPSPRDCVGSGRMKSLFGTESGAGGPVERSSGKSRRPQPHPFRLRCEESLRGKKPKSAKRCRRATRCRVWASCVRCHCDSASQSGTNSSPGGIDCRCCAACTSRTKGSASLSGRDTSPRSAKQRGR